MVEVGKIGDKTLVLDGRYISIFKARELLWKKAYMGYLLPDGNLYMYRRRVRITELSGNTLTDYQIKIEIGAGDPIWKHARSAGEDIRFCYYPEENMIPYWIEKFDPVAEEAIIWVKVPSIPANSEIEIYMYYGNPEVASASDGFATFLFFDDFEDGVISPWSTYGTVSEANSLLTLGTSAGENAWVEYDISDMNSGIIEYKARAFTSDTWINFVATFSKTTGGTKTANFNAVGADEIRIVINPYGTHTILAKTSQVLDTDTWYLVRIIRNGDYASVKVYDAQWNFINSATDSDTGADDVISGITFIDLGVNKAYSQFDWYRIRKYASPEPSVSVGAEE